MGKPIAVIGAGNGGTAIAAFLSSKGAEVHLCDLFPEYLADIRKNNTIVWSFRGKTSRQKVAMVTEDVKEALKGTGLIMVVTPSFTHAMIAEAVADALEDGQSILLNPGRTCGAAQFLTTLRSLGCKKKISVGETSTLIYSCRRAGRKKVEIYGTGEEETRVDIYGVKNEVLAGVIPVERTNDVLAEITPYYPQFKAARNCFETSLSNIGALFHPTPTLLNIGRIETDPRGFKYYKEGISPAVSRLVLEIDKERLAVAEAFGVRILSVCEWMTASYGVTGGTLYDMIQNNDAYSEIKAPDQIQVRYILEDVPMSLVPLSELGRTAGVPTPNIDAVIRLAETIYDKDFRKEGRSAKRMGIEGMTKEQVAHYFETGEHLA